MPEFAVTYCRYSGGHNQTEQSIEGQLRDNYEFAKRNGITIIEEYIDRAISGREFENRPEFQRMMRDSAKKKFSYVIVWKTDRFGRNREEIVLNKSKLKKNGVKLLYSAESIPEGKEGIVMESLFEALAEFFSADLAQKTTRGMRESVLKGNVIGGTIPIGYRVKDKRYVIDPFYGDLVKEGFRRYSAGESAKSITDSWNAKGIKTYSDGVFNTTTFLRMLRNEKYLGIYRWGEIVNDNAIPPIVDKELWDSVQKRLEANPQGKRVHPNSECPLPFLLTGKLVCGICGNPISGESGTGKKGKKYYYYKCNTKKQHRKSDKVDVCTLKNHRKEELEQMVTECTVNAVLKPDVISYLADEMVKKKNSEEDDTVYLMKSKQAALKDTEKAIKNIMTAIEAGIFTDTTKDRLLELEAKKKELTDQIALMDVKKPEFDKDQIEFFLYALLNQDTTKSEFMEEIIDTFIHKVYIYHDRLIIVYNMMIDASDQETVILNKQNAEDIASGVRLSKGTVYCSEASRTQILYVSITCFVAEFRF